MFLLTGLADISNIYMTPNNSRLWRNNSRMLFSYCYRISLFLILWNNSPYERNYSNQRRPGRFILEYSLKSIFYQERQKPSIPANISTKYMFPEPNLTISNYECWLHLCFYSKCQWHRSCYYQYYESQILPSFP